MNIDSLLDGAFSRVMQRQGPPAAPLPVRPEEISPKPRAHQPLRVAGSPKEISNAKPPRATVPPPPNPKDEPLPVLGGGMAETVPDRGGQEPRGCRWVFGDPRRKDWHYCQAKADGPYCPEHHARAYRSVPEGR